MVPASAATPTAGATAGATAHAAITATVEHGESSAKALDDDFGRITVIAALVLPFTGLQLAFDEDFRALFEVTLNHVDEAIREDRNGVPFSLFAAFASVLVFPILRRCDAQVCNPATVLEAPDFRVSSQIADQHYLIERTCHGLVSPVSCSSGTSAANLFGRHSAQAKGWRLMRDGFPLPVSRI